MREILFRGKLKVENGWLHKDDWVFGDYVRLHDGNEITKHFVYGFGEIVVKTLGEFTGLLDKNGIKIFEGDIVKDHFGNTGVVWFSEHFLRWQVSFYKGRKDLCKYPEIGTYIFDWIYPHVDFEVVGNIYDNPEILEERK